MHHKKNIFYFVIYSILKFILYLNNYNNRREPELETIIVIGITITTNSFMGHVMCFIIYKLYVQ